MSLLPLDRAFVIRLGCFGSARIAVAGCALLAVASVANPLRDPAYVTLSIPTEGSDQRLLGTRVPMTAYETDVRRIARVFHGLELPLPERITLRLYPSEELLARSLAEDIGLAPALAGTFGRFAAGVAIDDTMLVLESESRSGSRAWLRLLAHEMTHLSQIELAGGEGRGARWLAEGMADWVAFTVLDRLGIARMSEERGSLRDVARDVLAGTGARVELDRLRDVRAFLHEASRVGIVPVYRLSFLLADRLIERHGLARLAAYFRAFATGPDAGDYFERVFGERIEDFERAVPLDLSEPSEPCPSRSALAHVGSLSSLGRISLEDSHLDLTAASSELVIVGQEQQSETERSRTGGDRCSGLAE